MRTFQRIFIETLFHFETATTTKTPMKVKILFGFIISDFKYSNQPDKLKKKDK